MTSERVLRWSRGALGLSLLLLGATLWRAIDLVEGDPVIMSPAHAAPAVVRPPLARAESAIALAAGTDPFRAERAPPAARYRMPGEPQADEIATEPTGSGPPRLLGVVVLPGGRGVAMLQLEGESARLVRVGEAIGTLTLQSVAPGQATFSDGAGSLIEVSVARPHYGSEVGR